MKGSMQHNCEAYTLGVGNTMNDIEQMYRREDGVGVVSKRGNKEVTPITLQELQANSLVQAAEKIRPVCSMCADRFMEEAKKLASDGGFKLRVKVVKNPMKPGMAKGVSGHIRLSTVKSRQGE